MAKPKLLVLKGLQASGKSTFAAKLTEQGWVRTNKDDIRASLYCGNWKRKDEKQVVRVRNQIVADALLHRKNVVVDDTNLNPVHVKELEQIARQYDADFEVNDSFLQVSIEECIKRDLQRPRSVGESVIRDTFHKWIKVPVEAKPYDPSLPMAVIVDIDGTLAHMGDKRKPYDWHKVGLDDIDAGVAHLVDAIGMMKYAKVFLFSGRDEVCRKETEEWLERHDIEYDGLFMRRSNHLDAKGGQVKDTLVKREMYENVIEDQYNVLFVVDDRPSVCRMWRDELGLRVLQVGDPYYDF
jgi:predicted kinase